MGRVAAVALVCVFIGVGVASAQEPPPLPVPIPDKVPVVGGIVNEALNRTLPLLENTTGEDLSKEGIRLDLEVDMRDVSFSIVQILFGGGKVEADVIARLDAEFYAVSVQRLDKALQSTTGDANVSLNKTFGIDSNRTVLTAEEIRLIGGGVLLEAFQAYQETSTRDLLEDMLDGVLVLQSKFRWHNTLPGQYALEPAMPRLREPPIVLDAQVALNYLDRYSALELLASAQKEEEDPNATKAADDLQQRIEENQTLPFRERTAFMTLSYAQLFDVKMPPGWDLNLTVVVPKGFTVESVSDEFQANEDMRGASYFVAGQNRNLTYDSAGVVTVSNRFLVTSTLVGLTLLVGVIARALIEALLLGGGGVARTWIRRRRGQRPSVKSAS